MYQLLLLFLLLGICEKSNAQVIGESCSFTFHRGSVLLDTWIDDVPQKMMLSFIDDSYWFNNNVLGQPKHVNMRSEVISNRQYLLKSSTSFCNENYGIIGGDILKDNANAYLLDFDRNILSAVKAGDQSFYKIQGFKEIKSVFYRDKIDLIINIGWKDYKFAFDLTYSDAFSHQSNKQLSEKVGDGYFYNFFSPNNEQLTDYIVFPFAKLYINKVGYSGAITIGNNIRNRVGTGFLKGFNWIIDYQEKKVYFKKNYIPLDSNLLSRDYKATVVDGLLRITDARRGSNRYKIGSVVVAIDNIVVTSSNICELQNLLSSIPHWSDLSITTKDK